MGSMAKWVASAGWVLALCLPSTSLAQQQPAATIVLDGSGSMAGWLDGAKASKIDMARGALAPALATLAPTSRVGLVAFGHRRKGNCGDVEAIVAPEDGSLAKTTEALGGVQTVGKGPLVSAVKLAVEGLGTGPGRSIILIHDDPDNCDEDACAVASDIAKSHPGLPIHVVTVGKRPQTRAAMACLAATTGGKQFEASDEASINAAVLEAVKLAALEAVPAPSPAKRPDAGPEAKLPEAGLILSASLSSSGDAVVDKVRWRIRKDGDSDRDVIDLVSPEVVKALPAGRYNVEAQLGLARAERVIDVEDGKPSIARLDLKAGRLVVTNPADAGTGLMTLTRTSPKREPVFVGRIPAAPVTLPAGDYEVQFDDGLTRNTSRVALAEGTEVNVARPLAAGSLVLEAVGAEGGPPLDEVVYTIEKDDPDAPNGRREIARSGAPRPSFALPAGTYYVSAKANQVEARQQLAISPGVPVRQSIVLALARLTLVGKTAASLSPHAPPLNFRVISLDNQEREVARSSAASPVLVLPAGRYRVEATLGTENARATSDVSLQAGKDTQANLDIAAGRVRFDRAEANGAAIVEVRDDGGRVVWHAGAGETATAVLAPGRYRYSTPEGLEKSFDVKSGEQLTLKLGAP